VNVNTVFRLGSVSKCITASLTGTLVKDQLFQWDDKVTKYLPGFALKLKPNTDSLRIRHILSHTMGLPYHAYTDRVEARVPLDTLLYHLRDLDLIAAPGKVYSYQNVGYSLIEKIIQSITGKSYEHVLTEKMFKPLQMKDASASYERIIENANVAQPHYYSKQGWRAAAISDTYYNVAPAGGVNASITDMALWLKALLGARPDVLPEQTVSEMLTPQVKAISKNRNFWKWQRTRASYYAMGWRVLTFKNDTIDYHGGYVNGYRSEVALDRKNKMAICVLVNSAGNLSDQSIPQFFIMRSRYLDLLRLWDKDSKALTSKR
jgi:beta-lactamase class C